MLQQQTCKVCGRADFFDFHMPDDVWKEVVPVRLQNRVVCLACFDALAKDKDVDYSAHLSRLWFAGEMCSFEFATVLCRTRRTKQEEGRDELWQWMVFHLWRGCKKVR